MGKRSRKVRILSPYVEGGSRLARERMHGGGRGLGDGGKEMERRNTKNGGGTGESLYCLPMFDHHGDSNVLFLSDMCALRTYPE